MRLKNFRTIFLFCLLIFSQWVSADGLPSVEEMGNLRPEVSMRLAIFDRMFPAVAQSARQAHLRYTDPAVLIELEQRLERVRVTGNPRDILSMEEHRQYETNMKVLRRLEADFFKYWYTRLPMNLAISMQRWVTQRSSPEPQGLEREALRAQLVEQNRQNALYNKWNAPLAQVMRVHGPQTWGDLLLRFNEDSEFRSQWITLFPDTLPALKNFMEIWAWEDSSVQSVEVLNSQTDQEYWVLHRREQSHIPNRFQMNLNGDFEGLVSLEYAPTLFFNRISRISTEDQGIVYHLEAIEKGRTMELSLESNENGTYKKTFRGAELLRKAKWDEFLQRNYVQRGQLNLFLGLRTMQLNQIQDLMHLSPELVLAVGQFGFSVTGGRAQTVSNRTDRPREQLLKLTATLIDFIDFSQVKDVDVWFRDNTRHVLRTIIGGVGSGGTQALTEPTRQVLAPSVTLRSCRELF